MKKLILLLSILSPSIFGFSVGDYLADAIKSGHEKVANQLYFEVAQNLQPLYLPSFKAKFKKDPVKPAGGFDFGPAKTNPEKVAVIIEQGGVLEKSIGAMAKSQSQEDKDAAASFKDVVSKL